MNKNIIVIVENRTKDNHWVTDREWDMVLNTVTALIKSYGIEVRSPFTNTNYLIGFVGVIDPEEIEGFKTSLAYAMDAWNLAGSFVGEGTFVNTTTIKENNA